MRVALFGVLVAAGIGSALAADEHGHGPADLNPVQAEGRRLYQQACGICHTPPTITSPVFGPRLSKAVVEGGLEAQAKNQIANGSPNMPGYKYTFTPTQIDSIVEFLKLLPIPPAAPARAAPAPRNPASTPR